MNMIRFNALDNGAVIAQTEWAPEQTRECAGTLLSAFRQRYPNLAYQIERTGDSKVPNRRQVTRATIRLKDDVYYSRWFEAGEVDEQMRAIREKWPNADIATEVKEI